MDAPSPKLDNAQSRADPRAKLTRRHYRSLKFLRLVGNAAPVKTRIAPTLLSSLRFACATLAIVGCDASSTAGEESPTPLNQDVAGQYDEAIPDFPDFLSKVEGISEIQEIVCAEPGVRNFIFKIEQKLQHDEEGSETFTQRGELFYKSALAPTVLSTQGYELDISDRRDRVARILGANELRVEHRYFGDSIPEPSGYHRLRIKDSAADLHSVVERFRPLLLGSWISAGASKNGMTALYHRRFYPFDTQATIAYVAPNTFGLLDRRYRKFLDQVGTKKLRDRILKYQKLLLAHRDELVKLIPDQEPFALLRFRHLPGGLSEAFERAVHEVEFGIWQTYGPEILEDGGKNIPNSDEDILALIDTSFFQSALFYVSENANILRTSYHIQTQIELGSPGWLHPELEDLYTVDVEDQRPFLGGATLPEFDPLPMLDMYLWTSLAINRTILIYGDLDPYTAAAFGVSKTRIGEAYRFTAKNTAHWARIGDLSDKDQATAIEAIERWTGVTWNPELESLGDQADEYYRVKDPQVLLQEIKSLGRL